MQTASWLAHPFTKLSGRSIRAIALFAACLTGLGAGLSQAGTGVERVIAGWSASLRAHDASGSVHIVEIDARSIAAIDKWPWPRSNYAVVVRRLREAGASTVAFDVDFSANSTSREDRAFAAELARDGDAVILPTFGQAAGGGRDGWTDSLPIPLLRDHAILGAVSVAPDDDGYVRRVPIGAVTSGIPRPSLSAAVANTAGAAGDDFPVDYAIRPISIPRHSFIDVRDGWLAPGSLAGKRVVIGATAIELGDRYAVPGWGVIPGVVIQALAAETLIRGRPIEAGWLGPCLLALALAAAILRPAGRRALLLKALAAPAGLFASAVLLAMANVIVAIFPALAVVFVATGSATTLRLMAAAKRRRAHDPESGLPNRYALRDAIRSYVGHGLVTARIVEFERLSAGVGGERSAEIIHRVRDRISLVAEGTTIYRVEDRVLAWRVYDAAELDTRIKALRSAMLNPIEVGGRRVDVTLALGFAAEDAAPDKVLANAILAADRAVGGSGWHAHDSGEDETLDRELSLLGELDEAVGKGEIVVHYQPKLELRTGKIASVEALVRWQHSERGFLRPDLFIPLAERNDRIAGLTLHVLAQTIEDLRAWADAGHPITGAVNVSAKLLSSAEFLTALRCLVDESGIDPRRLTFEVTESAAMNDPEGAAAALRSFSDLGIGISMDDYGTGQSTLSYIKQLPLDELKIDRSFVQFAHQNRGDGVLVRSTIELAHELGLKVVAEGVEDEACLDFLRDAGCDYVQGYFVSRPVTAEALFPVLADWRVAA